MNQISIVFFGSAEFAVSSLRALHASANYSIELVVTQPDKPVGRQHVFTPTPVKQAAMTLGLPVSVELHDALNCSADIGVVVAYGQLLPADVLAHFNYGVLNIHPSLLPAWRGPAPIQAAMLAGDTETGVTIMVVDAGMDTGPILLQQSYRIQPIDTAHHLHDLLAAQGARLLLEAISGYIRGTVVPVPQSKTGVSYCSMIQRSDGKITGQDDPELIMRKLRAYSPWPGVYGTWRNKRLKILKAHIDSSQTLDSPLISAQLILDTVQLEGKPAMSFTDFQRGYSEFRLADLM